MVPGTQARVETENLMRRTQTQLEERLHQRRLAHVQAYRQALRCLQARIEGTVEEADRQSDEDLILSLGLASAKPNHDPSGEGWLSGPLGTMRRAVATLRELNYIRAITLESVEKKAS